MTLLICQALGKPVLFDINLCSTAQVEAEVEVKGLAYLASSQC